MSEQLPDGIHIGLPHDAYFEQDCMGSSDWIRLDTTKHGWWWTSRHNPRHKRTTSAEQNYGSALHVLMLEGEARYEQEFVVEPDKAAYPDLLITMQKMKEALEAEGYDVRIGKSNWQVHNWAYEVSQKLPDRHVWYNIERAFKTKLVGRQKISAEDDASIRFMRFMALDESREDNKEIRALLAPRDDHPPLVELSVFAEIDGIRRRWRFDRFYPALTMDLKSLGVWNGAPLAWEAGRILARRRWSIQRADYDIGRQTLYELVKAGQVHGGTLAQRRYLEMIVDTEPKWDWVWLVYQKPSSVKGTAPILMPIWDDWMSDTHQSGMRKLEQAIAFYRSAIDRWGLDRPWGRVEPLFYTHENAPRRVFIPHWEYEDQSSDDAAYERPDDRPA